MKKRLMHAQKLQKIKKACLKNNYNLKNTIYITSKNFFADAMMNLNFCRTHVQERFTESHHVTDI